MYSQLFRTVLGAIQLSAVLMAPRAFAQADTVRVGSHTLRPLTAGVDTVEVYQVTGQGRELTHLHIIVRAAELSEGRQVIRVMSQDGQTRTDARVDPNTHQLLNFERYARMDSTVFALQGKCFNGWSDFPGRPRKQIECVKAADRFGSGVLDALVVGALPLRTDYAVRLATFDAYGDITSFPVRVTGMDTLRVSGRAHPAWRVERSSVSSGQLTGAAAPSRMEITTTWWVDAAQGRVLQERLTVNAAGNTREALRVLRNW
jgi:hypothetical protein